MSILNIITTIIQEPFSIDFLYDDIKYNHLVSSIKAKLVKKIEPNQSIDNSFFEFKQNTLILYNLNYHFINKILRIATKAKQSGFYFNKNISKIKIELMATHIDSLLVFAFLFLYVLKHLYITNVHIGKLANQNESTIAFFIYYIQMNKHIEKMTVKNALCCKGIDLSIYDTMIAKSETLAKIKMCNADIEVPNIIRVISKVPKLRAIILIDSVFVYCTADTDKQKQLFSELIDLIPKTKLEKFSFGKHNKYIASHASLASFELRQLLSLLFNPNSITTFSIHDIMNHISNDSISSTKQHKTTNLTAKDKRNRLDLLFNFEGFTLFHLFEIRHYAIIDIGPMDLISFNSLISNLERERSVKTLICRFNSNSKPQLNHFDFLLNDKLYVNTIHIYNITIESVNDLVSILYNNHSIKEFVLCSFHSIINYSNNSVDIVYSNYSPFYYTHNIQQLLVFLFALKTSLKKIYHSKKLLFDLVDLIKIQKKKKIYIENKKDYYYQE